VWNDDFHHSAMVALTGRREAYYGDHQGTPQELISALKWGYLFQGQRYRWQGKERGTPTLDLAPARFVAFIQNHDQVANSLRGQRVHRLTSPARLRALTALLLLGPATPMLFQGQEFWASSPFLYFADRKGLAIRCGADAPISQPVSSIASRNCASWPSGGAVDLRAIGSIAATRATASRGAPS
jgi:maltooligosyltrehalose trehalohydrolase